MSSEDAQFASLNVHALFQHNALLERELLNKGIAGTKSTKTVNHANIARILQNSDYVSRQKGTLDVHKLRKHLLTLTQCNLEIFDNKVAARHRLLGKIFAARGSQRELKRVRICILFIFIFVLSSEFLPVLYFMLFNLSLFCISFLTYLPLLF